MEVIFMRYRRQLFLTSFFTCYHSQPAAAISMRDEVGAMVEL